METLMNGAIVTEAALLSFLVGLGITWILMHGLFRLLPVTARNSEPIRIVEIRQEAKRRRDAA